MITTTEVNSKMDVDNKIFAYPLSNENAKGMGVPLYSWGIVNPDKKVQDGDMALVEIADARMVAYVDFMPNRTTCIRYKGDKKGHGIIAKEGDPFNIIGKVINFRGGIRISY